MKQVKIYVYKGFAIYEKDFDDFQQQQINSKNWSSMLKQCTSISKLSLKTRFYDDKLQDKTLCRTAPVTKERQERVKRGRESLIHRNLIR